MPGNVLFVTLDQYRGDSLSALGHPVVKTPHLDELGAQGVVFSNHWASTAPCGPSRASLYTGTYLLHHRCVRNGTPLDARFTNVAIEARRAGYDPVLFGYTDTTVDPRTVEADDPRLFTYEGVLPGLRPVVHDPFDAGGIEWGRWLAARGRDVPSNPRLLYQPDTSYPGAHEHASTWAPALFSPEESESAFMTQQVIEHLERHGERAFFVHVSYIRPHPPYRCPPGYHDMYAADDMPPFVGHPSPELEAAAHPLVALLLEQRVLAAPHDERERRQLRATYHGMQSEVDAQLGRLLRWLDDAGLASETLVVVTSDHGEMGCDHWMIGKGGYFDESYHVPLIVRDPRPSSGAGRGRVVSSFTEAVDVMPTILEWMGHEVPAQADGWSLRWALQGAPEPAHWRSAAHVEWDFRDPALRRPESRLGIPSSHCALNVLRSEDAKYVAFGADPVVLPPLFFDLASDPGQLHDLHPDPAAAGARSEAAHRLLRWRMANDDRTLANTLVTPEGPVSTFDEWR